LFRRHDPFPCGSDLDEDALTTDSLFLIKLDQTFVLS
jgi:hypothetical protein